MSNKFKPCPICGGNDFVIGAPYGRFINKNRQTIIRCTKCSMQFIPSCHSIEEAIEKMNRRAKNGE